MSARKRRIKRKIALPQWSDGRTSPEAPGRYLRMYPESAFSNGVVRGSYWDGRLWYRAEVTKDGQSKTPPHRIASAFQFLPWSPA